MGSATSVNSLGSPCISLSSRSNHSALFRYWYEKYRRGESIPDPIKKVD